MREYKSGMGFAVWRWTVVGTYLTRLHILKTPWFGVMLHWLHEPDPYRDPHDHPVNFVSLCLRGGYVEWSFGRTVERVFGDVRLRELTRLMPMRVTHTRGQVRFVSMWHVHRIISVLPGTVTLAIHGRATQSWGFYPPREFVVPYREYQKEHPLP